MSADPADVRFITSLRREEDIAADAVWALFAAGLVALTGPNIVAAARAAQIHPARLREAQQRHEHGHAEKPSRRVVRAKDLFDYPTAAYEPNVGAGNDKRKAAKEPQPGRRICSRCRREKPHSEYTVKSRRTGALHSMCRDCLKDYQRTRYLTVEKQKLMNAAHLAFVVRDGDNVTGLVCTACGYPIRIGDRVEGDAALHHTACPPTPMPIRQVGRPKVTAR